MADRAVPKLAHATPTPSRPRVGDARGWPTAQDIIPVSVGGLREYKDPWKLSFGGLVPETFFKTNDDTFQKVTVAASSVHVHRQVIEQVGSSLVWDFFTEDHDVNFGVYHVPEGMEDQERDKHVPLVPLDRVNSHTDRYTEMRTSLSLRESDATDASGAVARRARARRNRVQHGWQHCCGQARCVSPGVGQLVLVDAS